MGERSILERLSALDTNTVSDALDLLKLNGALYGLRPLWECPKVVGLVSTVEFAVKPGTSASLHPSKSATNGTSDPRVLVISGGINGISCYDNVIENGLKSDHFRGVIIDGMLRDHRDLREAEYPVYGRGMVSGHCQLAQVSSGTPIQLRGLKVDQNDYVIADSSGTVFISTKNINKVIETAESIYYRQSLTVQSIQDGLPVPEIDAVNDIKQASVEDKELVGLFATTDTPAVSDALDKLGLPGQALNIMPLSNYEKVTVGPAFTVRYVPATSTGPPKGVGDWIDDVSQGDVILIDNGGRTDCTVWGDIMTQYAGIRGISGTVIDGVCRDVNRAIADNYPMFTAGRWMRTAKDRMEVASVNEPVGIGRVHVNPRDIVVADANGVVIVPRERAREVAEVAHWIDKSEERIREMIAGGATLGKARAELGYHKLQRKG
ncbi:probable demethylmenaquinone methyltransferase [Fusarium fujikuroi]|nr:probable demethylmenaquinone methyltransferase [Fusarium fujikuroi]